MKVMTVVGTRPEIIRLAAVMRRLDATDGIEHVLVRTGQNWDRQLDGIFFDEQGLRLPDHVLNVDVTSSGATLGDILRKTEAVLDLEQPRQANTQWRARTPAGQIRAGPDQGQNLIGQSAHVAVTARRGDRADSSFRRRRSGALRVRLRIRTVLRC